MKWPVGFKGISHFWRQRFQQWLNRRLKPASKQRLSSKNLFIFPTRTGFAFLLLIVLLWLIGTNYQNNLVLGLAFFLLSLLIVTILHTFNNLAGLEISAVGTHPCFVGDMAEVDLQLQRQGRAAYENLQFHYAAGEITRADLIDVRQLPIKLFVPVNRRGWFNPGRLQIESVFPLGLIRCWTHIDLDIRILAYPKPIESPLQPTVAHSTEEGDQPVTTEGDDFYGFKSFLPGESPNRIAWKHYARTGQVLVKSFEGYADANLWLDWQQLDGLGREVRLSRLCYWVLMIHKTERDYGLRLPGIEIKPGRGVAHRLQVLQALALYEWQALAAEAVQ